MENLDETLSTTEQEARGYGDTFEIKVASKMTGRKVPLLVYPGNMLGQVLEAIAAELNFDLACECFVFENARTWCCTFEQDTTIRQLGLQSGDTLAIFPNPRGIA